MKNYIILLISFLAVFSSNAHEYHFAFAEVEYNWQSNKIEASISVSTHDFEHELSEAGMTINHLEAYANDKLMQISISDKVLENFKVSSGAIECEFEFIGYEVLNSGMTYFYFESQVIELMSPITFQFDLMMDKNEEQQNKLIFINKSEKTAIAFLRNERIHKLKLDATEQ